MASSNLQNIYYITRGWYTITSVTTPAAGYVTYQAKMKLCETSVAHDIILTRDATVYGRDTSSGYSSEGVNTSTGNFTYKINDLALPGKGQSVVFDRAYNSQDGSNGPLGYSWTWSYNISLGEEADGAIVVRWGDGKIEVWKPNGAAYDPMYGVYSTLTKNPDNTFKIKRKDRTEFRFDISNRLSSIVDEYGNAITMGYTGANLTAITDTSGRTVALSYDASNRITGILDPTGRSSTFSYDVNGDLVAATNMGGKVTRYTYDTSHRMLTIVDPKGTTAITTTYDTTRDVVASQRDALGGETRYTYDVPNRVTTIMDAEGNTAEHHFDTLLRLTQEKDGRGFSSHRTYDEKGNVATAKDKNGNTTTFTYDEKGNVLTKTEPLGRVTSATYDADSNPLTKTDALGHKTIFEYDPANGNLLAQYACGDVPAGTCTSDPSVNKTTYTYDPATGRLLTVTSAAGTPLARTITNYYDTSGNLAEFTDAAGASSVYEYDAVGRKLAEYHPLGRATAYEYDTMDRLISVTDGIGGQSFFTYDANGNKVTHTDARAKATNFTYDLKDRLITVTNALNQAEHYCYDRLNRRTGVTNARNATATVVYDAAGNVLQEIDNFGSTVRHEYDANGNRTASTDAKGNRSTFTYDALNHLVETKDPLGNTATIEYDLNGNKTKVTDARGKSTLFTYDAFGRLVTTTDAEGNSSTNHYDLLGRVVKVTDARGNEAHFEYDELDRLVGVTDAADGTVGATYDTLGNRLTVTDPRGKVTTYTYDVLNRLTSETDPLGNASVPTYDAVGNLLTLSNADGTTTFEYDDINRVTEVTFPDMTTAAYTYDAAGNRTAVTDAAGITTSTYDLLDQLSSVTDPFGNTVGYTYDPNGNRTSTKYPGNRSVTYLFDQLNRLVSVQDWGGVATTYTYDTAGRLSGQVMGNGATVAYNYDDADRLVTKEDRASGGAVIASYTYTLDPNGNRTGMGMTQPLLPKVDLIDQAFTHNDGNQVVTNNSVTYTYDGKGNRKTAVDGAVTTQYAYDPNNRLTSVQRGADLWEYLYNSGGQRLASTVNGTQTRYLLDLNGSMETVLAEMTAANAVKRYYIYGDGLLYSMDGTTGERLYYHYDPIGSTVALTNSAGTVTDRYAYLPYGELAASSGTHENPFLYVGKFGVMRETNGLYFMRARFYDPGTMSFLGKDPVSAMPTSTQSINPYFYVQGNPILWSDPTGMVRWADAAWGGFKVVVGVVGMAAAAAACSTGLGAPIGVTLGVLAAASAMQGAADVGAALSERHEKQVGDPFQYVAGVAAGLGGHDIEGTMEIVGAIETSFSIVLGGVSSGLDPSMLIDIVDIAIGGGQHPGGVGGSQQSGNGTVAVPQTPGQAVPTRPVPSNLSNLGKIQRNTNGKAMAYPSAEYIQHRSKLKWFGGDEKALQAWEARKVAASKIPPTKYLDVSGYANGRFKESYKNILAEGFLDQQTLSYVEYRISGEIANLMMHKYGYTKGDAKEKRRAMERMATDTSASIASLYSQLISALSKHQVLIRDLAAMPQGTGGGIVATGVYAGGR